jgi:hypothetical protein
MARKRIKSTFKEFCSPRKELRPSAREPRFSCFLGFANCPRDRRHGAEDPGATCRAGRHSAAGLITSEKVQATFYKAKTAARLIENRTGRIRYEYRQRVSISGQTVEKDGTLGQQFFLIKVN